MVKYCYQSLETIDFFDFLNSSHAIKYCSDTLISFFLFRLFIAVDGFREYG